MATSSTEGEIPLTQENAEAQQPSNNPFDPLVDIVGLSAGEGNGGGALQNGGVAEVSVGGPGTGGIAGNGMFARAGVASADASAADRVAAVKAAMPGTQSMQQDGFQQQQQQQQHHQQQQQQQFGVGGANMHLAANPHLNAYSHAQQMQMQAQWAQQQQAMMQMYATYNMGASGGGSAAGYNTMNMGMGGGQQTMYGGMSGYGPQPQQASQQQLVVYQQGQQMMQAQPMASQMPGQWAGGTGTQTALVPYGAHASATGIGVGASATSVAPAMQADRTLAPRASDFRVKRGTKPTRVNDSDKAFGPILDELKARPTRSVDK